MGYGTLKTNKQAMPSKLTNYLQNREAKNIILAWRKLIFKTATEKWDVISSRPQCVSLSVFGSLSVMLTREHCIKTQPEKNYVAS